MRTRAFNPQKTGGGGLLGLLAAAAADEWDEMMSWPGKYFSDNVDQAASSGLLGYVNEGVGAIREGRPVPEITEDAAMDALDMLGPGLLGTIGGKLGKHADMDMLRIAEEAEEIGMGRDKIFDATGWWRGRDGKWRREIDDSQASLTFGGRNDAEYRGLLKNAINNENLYREYPGIGWTRTKVDPNALGGSYDTIGTGLRQITLPNTPPAKKLSTGLHETQHALQELEGLARGSNPAWEQARAERIGKEMRPAQAYKRYFNTAGEVEARNVQARGLLSPDDRRMLPPWMTEDVPWHEQILGRRR